MTKYMPFVYDNGAYLINDKCFMITGNHLEYLTALLNSKLFKFAFRDNFPELQGGTRELRKIFVEQIPIKKITDDTNDLFKYSINKLVKIKKMGQASTEDIDNEINKQIFRIYDLTNDEIDFIAKSSKVRDIDCL